MSHGLPTSIRSARVAGLAILVALSACRSAREIPDSDVAPAERTVADVAVAAQAASSAAFAPGIRVAWASTDTSKAPRISRLVLEVADSESVGGRTLAWVRVDARGGTKRVVGYEVLVESVDFLHDASIDPAIHRYVIYPPSDPPLEYVHARSGAPLLPRAAPRDWLPRPLTADLDSLTFLGRVFRRETTAEAGTWPRASARRFSLDPDLLIATSRDFRDDGSGHPGRDWRWTPLSPQDYLTMLDAGFDLFRGDPSALPIAADFPAFIIAASGWEAVPDLLLRGSYLGAVMYSDEPAVHVYGRRLRAGARSPVEMADDIALEARRTHGGNDKYGRGFLADQIQTAGFSYGEVVQPPYPAWDAIASAAWYELEAGAGGWCFESRLQPVKFAQDVERSVGVPFPSDPDACIRFHLALLRGAARHFHAPWGVSVFGQMDPAAADLLFPLAYDAGATYFWMWTSDGDHHVPYARQLQLARALREHADAHPRGDAAERTRTAAVALVLPWGYALDEYTFGAIDPSMWGIPSLPLTALDDAGVPYRSVLAAAMREVAALLETSTPFDILFLRDSETAQDYEEIRHIGTDATVRVERR